MRRLWTCAGTGNENNNIICKELTVVYCSDVLKGSLKSPACVISGKLRFVAPSTYLFFLRSHFRCESKFPYSVLTSIREKFSCIFERVRFGSCTHTLVDKQKKKSSSCIYTRGEAGIWSDGTRISAVHHRGLLRGSHVTMGGRDKADYSIYMGHW